VNQVGDQTRLYYDAGQPIIKITVNGKADGCLTLNLLVTVTVVLVCRSDVKVALTSEFRAFAVVVSKCDI